MTEGRRIQTYAELMAAIREQAVKLGATREQIDDVAGLTPGYAGKILSPTPIRFMAWKSFDLVLPALGLALVVVEDPELVARVRGRYCRRRGPNKSKCVAVNSDKSDIPGNGDAHGGHK